MTIPGWQPTQLVMDPQNPRFEPVILFRMFKNYMKRYAQDLARSRKCEKNQFEEFHLGNWVFRTTRGDHDFVRKTVKDLLTVWEALGLISESSKPLGPGPGGNWAIAIWVFKGVDK